MSMNVHYMTVYGIALRDGDKIEELTDDVDDWFYDLGYDMVVYDGMCGEYMVFGEVLSDIDQYHLETSMVVVKESESLEDKKAAYIKKFKETFPEKWHSLIEEEWGFISFCHIT